MSDNQRPNPDVADLPGDQRGQVYQVRGGAWRVGLYEKGRATAALAYTEHPTREAARAHLAALAYEASVLTSDVQVQR